LKCISTPRILRLLKYFKPPPLVPPLLLFARVLRAKNLSVSPLVPPPLQLEAKAEENQPPFTEANYKEYAEFGNISWVDMQLSHALSPNTLL
jgi:hypothetical protein